MAKKLGLKEGHVFLKSHMPASVERELSEALVVMIEKKKLVKDIQCMVMFVRKKRDLESRIAKWKDHLSKEGMLWICWPKKTSVLCTDITREVVRDIGLLSGLVDVKICAVDDDWSALKFVYRKSDR